MRFVREVDGGNTWGVAHFDAIVGGRQLPPEIANQLPPITWITGSGNINGGVRATVRVEARDETSANDLRQVVQGFIALARLQATMQERLRAKLGAEHEALIETIRNVGYRLVPRPRDR